MENVRAFLFSIRCIQPRIRCYHYIYNCAIEKINQASRFLALSDESYPEGSILINTILISCVLFSLTMDFTNLILWQNKIQQAIPERLLLKN